MDKEEINVLKQVLKARATIPILKKLMLKDGKLHATNLDIWATVDIQATEPDQMLEPTLLDDFTIEQAASKSDPKDFPELSKQQAVGKFTMTADDMANLVWCSKFVSKDYTRPVLTGVWLTDGVMVGCDGYHISKRSFAPCKNLSMVVPSETVAVLAKAGKHDWEVEYADDGTITFKTGRLTIHSRTINGTIPGWREFYGEMTWTKTVVLPKGFKVPKGYMIRFGEKVVELFDKDNVLPTDIAVGTVQTISQPDDFIMALASDVPDGIEIDPKQLKPWGSKSVRLWADPKSLRVKVEMAE